MSRKYLLTFCFGISMCFSFGQDTSKVKKNQEYFLEISSFSPIQIGLNSKTQIKNNTYFKIGLLNINTSYTVQDPIDTKTNRTSILSLNGGIGIGIEFRKELSDFLTLYHGPNLLYTRHYDRNSVYLLDTNTEWGRVSNLVNIGGLSYSIGLLAKIKTHLLIAADLNPMISIKERIDYSNGFENRKSHSIDMDLTNQLVKLSIVFRR